MTDFVEYNGITLKIVHVLSHVQRNVYDPSGTDFLYVHHRLAVRCIWNPQATADGTKVAAESIANLRATLMTPRKLLVFGVPNSGGASKEVVSSPLKNPVGVRYPCDSKNGPLPIALNIVGVVGQKTIVCDFEIETWVRDCTSNRPIISHRWEMAHTIDRNFLTTRTINGLAIFRTDWLNQVAGTQSSPDQFRGWLFHPVPDNFQRAPIQVQLSADNTTLRYSITDQQQYHNIKSAFRDIIEVEVTYSEATGQASITPTAIPEAALMVWMGNPIAGADKVITFPKTTFTLFVRVKGRPGCSIPTLRAAVANIMASMSFGAQPLPVLGILIPRYFFHASASSISLTDPSMFAQFTAEVSAGAGAFQRTLGFGPAGGTFTPNAVFSQIDGPTSNPGPEFAIGNKLAGNREFLQLLVAQLFTDPCSLPPQVPQDPTVPQNVALGDPTIQA